MEQYFGSEVDIRLRTAEDPLGPPEPKPKKVDLEALDAKPFKDATNPDSIKKLEQKLEKAMISSFGSFQHNHTHNCFRQVKEGANEDLDETGRKVSALFLAQVEVEEDEAKAKKEREDQKKSFLDKMRSKKEQRVKADIEKEEKLFKKTVRKLNVSKNNLCMLQTCSE